MFFKIWNNCRNLRFKLGFLLFITVVDAVLATFSISLILPITSASLGDERVSSLPFSDYIPPEFLNDVHLLLFVLAGLLGLKFMSGVVRVLLVIRFTENLRFGWTKKLCRQYILQPFKYMAQDRQGEIVNDLINETKLSSNFVLSYLNYMSQIVMALSILALLFAVNWVWIGGAIVVILLAWFTVGKLYFRFARQLGQRAIELNQSLNTVIIESLQGIKDIKISNSESFQVVKINKRADRLNWNRKIVRVAQSVPNFGKEFLLALLVLGAAFYAPADLMELRDIMPELALFLVAFARLAASASVISTLRFRVMSKFPSFVHVIQRLNQVSGNAERLDEGQVIESFGGHLSIKGLEFSYDEDGDCVLRGLDLDIRQGQVVCLFGSSGCGKTTLMDIISRLYDADSGEIVTGNGRALDFSLSSWRRLIGYVPQEPMIYYGSIRDNMVLGHDGIPDDVIMKACDIAGIADFVRELPDGLDSLLQEGGSNLSGGQKKRLALARAIAQGAELIIMDETTNAIQEEAEREILANLKAEGDLMVLLISHRESTMDLADICYEIDGGKAALKKS